MMNGVLAVKQYAYDQGKERFQDIPNMQMMNFGMMMLTWNNCLRLH